MFERRVWVIGNIVALVLLLLSGGILYWQLIRGNQLYLTLLDPLQIQGQQSTDILSTEGLQELPQPLVQRTVDMLKNITRGSILDRTGAVLAHDEVAGDGSLRRVYDNTSLANVIGYTTGIRTGAAGLERHYNTTLLGVQRIDSQIEQLVNAPIRGSDLNLTIDAGLQQQAVQALGSRAGSIVILDGHTGAVLAMASTPTFDPNRVQDQDYVNALLACNDPTCRAPFVNRATQALYPPGSTWKTVTLIAALDSGQVTPQTSFDFGEPLKDSSGKTYYVYRVGGGVIPDPNHTERVLELPMAYAKSANAAFAKIGDQMDPNVLVDYAARLGFSAPPDQLIPTEIAATPSRLANDVEEIRTNDLLRAATAIGQGELQTNAFQMAVVALPVLNGGNLPIPYLVDSIHDPAGLVHKGELKGQVRRGIMKPETAKQVRDMMITVVEKGYGSGAKVPGMTVGGKTGTAQLGGDQAPHAWFLGWAEKGKQAVVICVMVENGGEGSLVAAPIFAGLAGPAMDVLTKK